LEESELFKRRRKKMRNIPEVLILLIPAILLAACQGSGSTSAVVPMESTETALPGNETGILNTSMLRIKRTSTIF
jgi:uncharacterized lipoprotein YajG